MSRDKDQVIVYMPIAKYESLIPRKAVDDVVSKYTDKMFELTELIITHPKDSMIYITAETKREAYREILWALQTANYTK